MATVDIDYDDVSLQWGGYIEQFDIVVSTRYWKGLGSQLNFRCTGESLTIEYWTNNASQIRVTVDGTPSTPALTADSAWHDLTIYTGEASDSTHEIEIKSIGAGLFFTKDVAFMTVTDSGVTPSISLPTPSATVPAPGTEYTPEELQIEGEWGALTSDGYANSDAKFNVNNCCLIRFIGNPTSIWVWGKRNGPTTKLIVDGVVGDVVIWSGDNEYGWQKIADSLDGSSHTYEIAWSYVPANVLRCLSAYLIGGTVASLPDVHTPQWGFYGDSLTQFTRANNDGYSAMDGFAWLVSRDRGVECLSRGIASTTVQTSGNTTARTNQITTATPTPTQCVVLYGVNDFAIARTEEQFRTDYDGMIAKLVAGASNMKIVCLGMLDRTAIDMTDWSAVVAASVAAANNPNVTYLDMAGVITPATDTYDGTHPNNAGYTKITTFLLGHLHLPLANQMGTRLGLGIGI